MKTRAEHHHESHMVQDGVCVACGDLVERDADGNWKRVPPAPKLPTEAQIEAGTDALLRLDEHEDPDQVGAPTRSAYREAALAVLTAALEVQD